ncbi:MAG: hypothetical protein SVZ03_12075 [Spirochaetota bacterium]|nr:hypothetical protein [Spirochaetota bacterium]
MSNNKISSKIVPINWVDNSERWILAPGTKNELRRSRIKEVPLCKNNCYFTIDVPKGIIDFIYRSVKQLNLGNRTLIFTKGTVRKSKKLVKNAVSLYELDWGVGTLITIPRILKYREQIILCIEDIEYSIRLMELIVLHGLLQLSYPRKNANYYSVKSALILTKGWSQLNTKEFPDIYKKT